MSFITDWKECYELSTQLVTSPGPMLLSRIGGSDTNAVASYLEARESDSPENLKKLMSHRDIVQRYNGYYDQSNTVSRYIEYLDELLSCYKDAKNLFFCNFQLLSMHFRENINEAFYASNIEGRRGFELLVSAIGSADPDKLNMPYTFVEKLMSHPYSLFNSFAETLRGKRVLVISPFSESITSNFDNRHSFFKGYDYPDFSLILCNTPITYSGLPSEFYPHNDWFETTAALKEEVSKLEFDVALLSCGSYAMPIGNHITNTMQRKAIYVGGVLQLYFGVLGRRYADNVFFLDQINREKFIFPIEGQRFMNHVSIGPDTAREAFGAYF